MLGQTASPKSTVWNGTIYTTVTTPLYFSVVMPHPTQRLWLLACGMDSSSIYQIHYSQDGGVTWGKVADALIDTIVWATPQGTTPDTRLFFIDRDGAFRYTDDFGVSSSTVVVGAADYHYGGHFLTVGVNDPEALSSPDRIRLFTARDWGFGNGIELGLINETKFTDRKDVPQAPGHQILNEATGIWLGTSYESTGHYGTLYQSDRYGIEFSLHNGKISSLWGSNMVTFDYTSLSGFDGATILTNTVENWQQVSGSGSDKSADELVTWVTYDAGGAWSKLAGPSCSPSSATCRLNLHGTTSLGRFDPVKSVANAVGIVIGTGNDGDFLSYTTVNTYLSTDIGRTWTQLTALANGAYFSQISAGGGVIIFVPKNGYSLYYTYDSGATLSAWAFASEVVQVDAVETDPEHLTQTFFIYGRTASAPFLRSITFNLPTCGSADIETWIPQECVLGQTVKYTRKIPSAICAYNAVYNAVTADACDCTRDDFECAYGYTLNPSSLECELSGTVAVPYGQPPICPEGAKYEDTRGYRLVPGDKCTGGVSDQYAPEVKDCVVDNSGLSTGIVFLLTFIIAAIVLILAFVVSLRFEAVRERLPGKLLDNLPPWLVGGYVPQPIGDEDDELGTAISPDILVQDQEEEEPEELNDDNIDRHTKQRKLFDQEDDFNPRSSDP